MIYWEKRRFKLTIDMMKYLLPCLLSFFVSLTVFANQYKIAKSINSAPVAIWDIVQHPDGTIWAGSDEGVIHYNSKSSTTYPVTQNSAVVSICIDSKGTVWAGTETAVLYY